MSKHHNTDHYYLDAAEREYLERHLDEVRDIIGEMAIILTMGQAIGRDSLGVARPQPGSREPYNLHIKVCLDELTNALTTTIRHVCEMHDWLIPNIGNAPATQAKWIYRNLMTLAATDGAEDCYNELIESITKCQKSITREDTFIEANPEHREIVANKVGTAEQIEAERHKYGPDAVRLTARRVRYIAKLHGLPFTQDGSKRFYLVRDVLQANSDTLAKRA